MPENNTNRQQPTVSIVLPVYNEEAQLAACLDAIACQTTPAFEVIVVDNNSTDRTVEIARTYPFVRVLHEARQGVVHARNRGFNNARGEIIGRLDTDTRLPADWVARVQTIFANPSVGAVSGAIGFYDMPFPALFNTIESFFRRFLARTMAPRKELFLYGGNMAIRRDAWQEVRGRLCVARSFHEDMDMAAHLAHTSCNVIFDEKLQANISARLVDRRWRSFYPYVMANSRTYAAHNLKSRYFIYPVEWLALAFYLLLRITYRSYDAETRRFSLRNLIRPAYEPRVSPVSDSA